MSRLQLSFGVGDNPRTRPLIDDRIRIEGVDAVYTVLFASELFWRQLKYQEFDFAEMSLSTWMRMVARGETPFVGLPVFTTRHFFHTHILVRRDAGIVDPGDLKGKRVGVPEYQQTAALWSRGILQNDFGVRPSDMEFWMERTPDTSHSGASGFNAPEGVVIHQIPKEKNIGSMMLSGELDATLLYLNNRNLVDRSRADLHSHPDIRFLFDVSAENARYYKQTGIFPINHLMVMRRELFERAPWLALNVVKAFQEAAAVADRGRIEHVEYHLQTGLLPQGSRNAIETQLVEHGVLANRQVIEKAAQYSWEQGLTQRQLGVEDLFAPATLEI